MKTTKEKVIHKAGSYKMRKAVNLLRVLTLDRNIDLVNYLLVTPDKAATVTELYIKLRCEQSEASNSLKELIILGLVNYHIGGKNHYYYANVKKVKKINRSLNKFFKT